MQPKILQAPVLADPIEEAKKILLEAANKVSKGLSLREVLVFIKAETRKLASNIKKDAAKKEEGLFSIRILSIACFHIEKLMNDSTVESRFKPTIANRLLNKIAENAEKLFRSKTVQPTNLAGNFQQDILVWKIKFEKLLELQREGAAKAREIAGAFINMILDPLNSQHVVNLRSKLKTFKSDLQADLGGEYRKAAEILLEMFGGISGVNGDASRMIDALDSLAVQLETVQLNTAILDNSAQFIDFSRLSGLIGKGSNAGMSGKSLGLSGYDKAYFDARAKLTDTSKNSSTGYSNYELYQALSQAYIGDYTSYYNGGKYVTSGNYLQRDLIALYEGIYFDGKNWVRAKVDGKQVTGLLENKEFARLRQKFKKEFGSKAILSLNLRAQYDLFFFTKPAMEKQGLWNKDGVKQLEQIIAKLDPTLSFSAEYLTPAQGLTVGFSIEDFNDSYAAGKLNMTIITLQNGQQIKGNVTKDAQGNYQVGELTINATTGKAILKAGGSTEEVQIATFLIPDETIGSGLDIQLSSITSNLQNTSSLQQFPSVKLEGFFAHAMPILARYPSSTRMDMVDIISASQDAIISQWSQALPTTSVISDITSARRAVMRFNQDLERLLVSTNARDVAINEVKASDKVSDMKTVTQWEKTFKELTDNVYRQTVVVNPFVNVHYTQFQYYKEHDGVWISPESEADLKRFFSPEGLQMVQDPIEPSVNIDKYAYSLSASVAKAITDAVILYGPKEAPKLYFNSADLYSNFNYQKENDRSYWHLNAGGLGFWGRNTFLDANFDFNGETGIESGSFRVSTKNMPISKSGITLRDGRVLGDVEEGAVFSQIEAYMLAQMPLDNNAAFFIKKDNKTGKFSVRVAARTTNGDFKTLVALENLEDRHVAVLLSHFELNNKLISPSFTAKFNSEIPKDRDGILKYINSKDFAGMVFATNIGQKVGLALFDDPNFDSKSLSNEVRDLLVKDDGRGLFWPTKYDRRQAISLFYDVSSKIGLYADITNTKFSEHYVRVKDPRTGEYVKKKVQDTKMSPDEFAVRFVKDNSFSIGVSLNRRTPGGTGIDSYSFDGKVRLGKTKMQFSTLYGNSLDLLPYSFANLDLSENIGASKLVVTNSDKLRRYAYVNLLYNTKGKLWKPNEVISRSIAARYDNLLGITNSSLALSEQFSKVPGFYNAGFGAIFTKNAFDADFDIQTAGNYRTEMYLVGANVRNIQFKGGSISFGGLYGQYRFQEGLPKYDVIGGGTRITIGNVKLALQAAYLGDPGAFAAALGLQYDAKDSSFYFIASGRKEKSYQAWNLYTMIRGSRFGVYLLYDNEKIEIVTNPGDHPTEVGSLVSKLQQRAGAQLFYSSPNGMWRVSAGLVWKEEFQKGEQYRYDNRLTGQIAMDYFRVPGADKPWWIPSSLASASFILESDLRRTQDTDRRNIVARMQLRFVVF
ncbi:MAG: hypothetical protein N3E51_04425 [Candidatus Micrarchaeota archaeon]|nr:hypothetical protein [Candidatus Micrarchaeota archaeon]